MGRKKEEGREESLQLSLLPKGPMDGGGGGEGKACWVDAEGAFWEVELLSFVEFGEVVFDRKTTTASPTGSRV